MKPQKVMIVAGEASGDLYGARLAACLLQSRPDWDIYGAGGSKMKAAGVRTLVNSEEMAVVGISEVIAHFPVIWKAFHRLTSELKASPPDLLVLIDYPDFNLRLAKKAAQYDIPVFYYISPQVWAWRAGRVKTIARLVKRMLVLFQFEVDIYRKTGLDCHFVGHPLLDEVLPPVGRDEALKRLEMTESSRTVALLPGSRKREVEELLPRMLDAGKLLKERFPDMQFVLPVASTIDPVRVQAMVAESGLPVKVVREQVNEALAVSDAAVVASGTATLQTALMGRAMVIVYTVSPFTYLIGRLLIKLDSIGLANLVAGKKVAPELIQHEVTPERIAREVIGILEDTGRRGLMEQELTAVRQKLGGGGASQRVAGHIMEFLEGQSV